MEIEKTEIKPAFRSKIYGSLKPGNLVRVKVLHSLGRGYFLVELKGKIYHARLSENIQNNLFIAKVSKLKPYIELKFIKGLDSKSYTVSKSQIATLLQTKKSFIHNLINSDNFFVNLAVLLKKDRKGIRENIKHSIRKQNIKNIVKNPLRITNEIKEYFILQNIYNYINNNSCYFCFPLRLDKEYHICELKVFGDKESTENGFFLLIHLDEERKVGFLIFYNYEVIICTVSTNDDELEGLLKINIQGLIKNLKDLDCKRKIEIHFAPYREQDFARFSSIKKIDIKM